MKTESLSFEDFNNLVDSTPETTVVRSSKPSAPASMSFEEFTKLAESAPKSPPVEVGPPQLPPDSPTAYGLAAGGEGGKRQQPWDHRPIEQPEPPFMGGQRGYDEAGNKIEPPLVPAGVLEAASARKAAKMAAKAAQTEEILGRVRAGRDPKAILYPASALINQGLISAAAPAAAPVAAAAPVRAPVPAPVPPMEVAANGLAPRLNLGNATMAAREALAEQQRRDAERSEFLESTSRLKPSVAAPAPALQTIPKEYDFDMFGKVTHTDSAGKVSDLGIVKTNNQAYQMIADHQKRASSLPVRPPAPPAPAPAAPAPVSTSGNTAQGMSKYVSRAPAEPIRQGGPLRPAFEQRPLLGVGTPDEIRQRGKVKLAADRAALAQAQVSRPALTAEDTQWPAGLNPKWVADAKGLRSGALEMYGKPFGRYNDSAEAFAAAEKHVYRSKIRTN